MHSTVNLNLNLNQRQKPLTSLSLSAPRALVMLRSARRHLSSGVRTGIDPAAAAACDHLIAQTRGCIFVDGEYRAAEGGDVIPVYSPQDGKPFTEIANASVADVNSAVESARRCFNNGSGWSSVENLPHRISVMKRIAAALREIEEDRILSTLETRDCGKTLSEAAADMEACADYFDYFADISEEVMAPETLSTGTEEPFTAAFTKEAIGVVGCVTPWNYPLMQAVLKVAPAIAAGCSVVLKPAPNASLTCLALGQIAKEAGMPAGALNILTGGPPDNLTGDSEGLSTGQTLIDHPGLDKLSFTGSGAAGRAMLTSSAAHLRPTSLELGGKSAAIVFDDARSMMGSLVDWLMVGIFCTTGQICSATSRLIVEASLHDELVAELTRAASSLCVGHPLDPKTQMGPLVSATQKANVEAAVERAAAQGATVIAPKLSLTEDGIEDGYYVPPTILTNVSADSEAWIDEIFGPVLCVSKFTSEEEALELANASNYGLAGAVFSTDENRCTRVASSLEAGVVWSNCSNVLFNSTPFHGKIGKKSGFGYELGHRGLEEYLCGKTMITATPGYSWEWFGETSRPNDL